MILTSKKSLFSCVVASLVLALLFSASGCRNKRNETLVIPPPDEETIKTAIAGLKKPNKQQGMIKNVWKMSAERLGEAGPSAKEFGGDKALEKFIATTKDAEAKEAAKAALAKINGQ